jgi:hypothetical protein
VIWKTLDVQMEPALEYFEKWGVKGIKIDLSFLGSGPFQAEIIRDGEIAHRAGVDYARDEKAVTASERLAIHLAPGADGWRGSRRGKGPPGAQGLNGPDADQDPGQA